jgi:hypothetical protein
MHFSLESTVRKHLTIRFRKDIAPVLTVGNFWLSVLDVCLVMFAFISRPYQLIASNNNNNNFGLGSSSALCPLEALHPVWLMPVVYCTIPRFSKSSYFARQVPLASTTRCSPLAARGGTMDEKWWLDGAWDMYPRFFYMPQICDMGPIILLPFRRKACWGFLSPFKNPTASAGFGPANLGSRGQHATSAPPKPLV